MQQLIFVDTSAWLAVMDAGDSHHAQAADTYARLLKGKFRLVTTILVVAETQIWLRRRMNPGIAQTFLKNVNHSPRVDTFYPTASMERQAKVILEQYADHDFSLTDAVSFVVMKELEIKEAFTYDKHFATAGFTPLA